ncbi:hypothetical protein KAR91_84345 [Candidatus Pacearchaeota archaeon]|nr:hypothetical protein [Candidatus Pacearchaeota archaeon]
MQWLIDLIKEWVIAQGYATIAYVDAEIATLKAWVIAQVYATEAWVLEWITPMHVTGTLDPRANCTYHKGGTHNDRPYYLRDDAEWYIWWNGVDRWWISSELGITGIDKWSRIDPDIEGDYTNQPFAEGTATVTFGYGCPHLCFVDRGDPAAADFAIGDLTKDGAYHDLDLSGIVPAGAKSVSLSVIGVNAFVNKFASFRTDGNANEFNISLLAVTVALVLNAGDIVVPVTGTHIIEYNLTAGGWVFFAITVKGWWF